MTDKIEDGGPAFPCEAQVNSDYGSFPQPESGMSIRDYFAAKAMQGFAADPECSWKGGVNGMARSAYDMADAMLKARK